MNGFIFNIHSDDAIITSEHQDFKIKPDTYKLKYTRNDKIQYEGSLEDCDVDISSVPLESFKYLFRKVITCNGSPIYTFVLDYISYMESKKDIDVNLIGILSEISYDQKYISCSFKNIRNNIGLVVESISDSNTMKWRLLGLLYFQNLERRKENILCLIGKGDAKNFAKLFCLDRDEFLEDDTLISKLRSYINDIKDNKKLLNLLNE